MLCVSFFYASIATGRKGDKMWKNLVFSRAETVDKGGEKGYDVYV